MRLNKAIITGSGLFLLVLAIGKWMGKASLDIPEEVTAAMASLPDELDYNLHVKRILSDKCFSCHGPDAAKQKGDLRLDLADAAFAKKAESGLYAIDAGSIANSEMAHRILSSDKDYMMPTPASHLSLTVEEKATLLKWIDQGAKYKPHWAFVAPEKKKLPEVKQKEWVKNEIDQFVLARLEKEGLTPSAEADKETLIRRVAFDLTGLPPTIEEIDAFLKNDKADAYEKMVDHFLQSPRYGERMAAWWLDVARFADSHGYLDDKHRDASPWRDWVIKAYNSNLPYDQFISWQLAGDLMPNATKEQILATGFNRNQKQNSEAGILPEEFRVEYVVDRTNTLGTALMGLTVSCAKCHDHKYDPISQKEYFSLYAFFNSTFELGSPNFSGDNSIVPGPTLMLSSPQTDMKIDSIKRWITSLESHIKPKTVALPEASINQKIVASLTFDKEEKLRFPDKNNKTVSAFRNTVQAAIPAELRAGQTVAGISGRALELGEETLVHFPPYTVGYYERYQPFSFSLWLNVPKKFDDVAVLHQSDPRRYGFQGYDLVLKENKLNFRLMHAFPHDAISVESVPKLDSNKWHHVAVSYDGSSSAKGVQLYIDGKQVPTRIEYDNLKKNIRSHHNIHKIYEFTGLSFGARTLERTMKGGKIDQFCMLDQAMTPAEAAWLYAHPGAVFSRQQRTADTDAENLQGARKELADLYDSTREVMVMADLPEPRKTHVLLRGVYDSYGDEVKPGTPASVLPFPDNLPKNRLGLSRWLFLPENPLTSRIAVNHIWEMYFGRGLVKTSDDFGNQGEMPSHPELLDYLSIKYREEGWDTKKMQKFILMSATYRQQSVISPLLHEKDPQNILLARSSRYKMPAEMIRDNALSISGLLSSKIGGPSVYPYQPAGLWEALSDKSWRYVYKESEGEDLFRRSIYTIVKRSSPPPFMLIFDAPDRNFCTVKRTVSNSPLQALAMLNDPTFIEASKFVAARMMQLGGATPADQLVYGFRLVTGRKPGEQEHALLQKMYSEELENFKKYPAKAQKLLAVGHAKTILRSGAPETAACVNVVMALLNTDEFITRK